MKRILMLVILLSVAASAPTSLAIPHLINYQGYLTRTDGSPLDTTVSMAFVIYESPDGNDIWWSETHPSVVVTGGLFNVLLGSVQEMLNPFAADRWLGISVGNNAEMSPRHQIASVANAFRTGTVDGATGGTVSGSVTITGKGNIGWSNTNTGIWSFVAGSSNDVSGAYSTIAGGRDNDAPGDTSAIGGGIYNTASAGFSTVGGGESNIASGRGATVGGGRWNRARGDYSVVAGGGGELLADTNSASGVFSTVGGGSRNYSTNSWTTVSGGFSNRAIGNSAAVGGGQYNTASGDLGVVGGGVYNVASGYHSGVLGGQGNEATNYHSVIGGGRYNHASGYLSAIVGGGGGSAADSNSASGDYSFVGGGTNNTASGDSAGVCGGSENTAGGTGSVVGGGHGNAASGYLSTVGGGTDNEASSNWTTVSGGIQNIADAPWAVVPGGYQNRASGGASFAAGYRAYASGDGVFAWADATGEVFSPGLANSFNARASGGFRFYTDAAATIGARLFANGTAWVAMCDSTKKNRYGRVNTHEVLDRVAKLPIETWSYKADPSDTRHVGPMAQDFWNAFHLGEDSLGISTLDPDGVALAAIQELAKQVSQLREDNTELRSQIQSLLAREEQTQLKSEK